MVGKKLILINGIITIFGILMDIYGYLDLSRQTAMFGLFIGIVDVFTFIWLWRNAKKNNKVDR